MWISGRDLDEEMLSTVLRSGERGEGRREMGEGGRRMRGMRGLRRMRGR